MLLDSSVFIRWSRQRQNPARTLRVYVRRGELKTCGVVRAEVLRGTSDPARRIELLTLFSTMEDIPTNFDVWEKVAMLAWTLDRQGKILPLPDIIIAACALEVDVPLVTFDGHFASVPGLTVYSDLP